MLLASQTVSDQNFSAAVLQTSPNPEHEVCFVTFLAFADSICSLSPEWNFYKVFPKHILGLVGYIYIYIYIGQEVMISMHCASIYFD